jgi:HK97 family phage prohead protease
MLRKTCSLAEFKLSEEGDGGFSGYASTFGNKDRAGEIVMPGAFAKCQDEFKRDGFIAVGHNWAGLPVATITDCYEDRKGFFIQCEFHSTPEAQAARCVVRERIDRGKSVGLSIGYEVKEKERTAAGLLLKELHVFETSIVTVPCNPEANATGAKSEPQEGSKGNLLGSYAEADISCVALGALWSRLYWYGLDPVLYDDSQPVAERIAQADAALQEFHELALLILSTLLTRAQAMDEAEEDALKALAAEAKSLFPMPADLKTQTGVDALPAGASFPEELGAARDAALRCKARAQEIIALRAREGRTLSAERKGQIQALAAALADAAAEIAPLVSDAKAAPASPPAVDEAKLLALKAAHLRQVHALNEASLTD